MKSLLLLFSTFFILQADTEVNSIIGTWRLDKIELESTTLQTGERDYLVTFDENKISYNLDVNSYQSNDIIIENNSIQIENLAGTKICCDGINDSLSNYIDYSGSYIIKENVLIITNSSSNKLDLSRYN